MADKNPNDKALADARKRVAEETAAAEERMNSSQPTPTQEENDRAKLGFESLKELDDKEDDRSLEQSPAITRDVAAEKPGSYKTK